ncbi:translation machinery-associated protein 20 [Tulasnella sp. 419]|nr:translation machinery-associated protein 20 [Tulasnella sp. 418]KAG8968285.1 translation machinery-associated protein 20 [Tulasnella sp. 419]
MFKKFSPQTDIAAQSLLKSSVQRQIRAAILAQYPHLADNQGALLEQIWPKKENITHVKCKEHVSIYTLHGEPLFYQSHDGPLYPTLRLLHKYPDLLPKVQVDRGAIRFLLAGANMMCPGFTSAGGRLPPPEAALPANTVVAIHTEGKELPAAIGLTRLSTEDIKRINKDVGVEIITYLGDDLWTNEKLS